MYVCVRERGGGPYLDFSLPMRMSLPQETNLSCFLIYYYCEGFRRLKGFRMGSIQLEKSFYRNILAGCQATLHIWIFK
jgi:hypothetical protein